MSVWVQFTWVKASWWAHRNFLFQSKTIFYHGFAIMVCTRPVIVEEKAVLLSPVPAALRGTPDMFYKHMSQIIALRLHLDCFDVGAHQNVVAVFTWWVAFVSFSIRTVRSCFYAILAMIAFSIPWCTVHVGLLEQEGKRLSLEAEKNVKLHTPDG